MGRRHFAATIWGSILAFGLGLLAHLGHAFAPASFDWLNWGRQLTDAVMPVFGIVVLYYLRQLSSNSIPKMLLPFLGTGIATLGAYLATLIQNGNFDPITAAIVGYLVDWCYTTAKEWVGDK